MKLHPFNDEVFQFAGVIVDRYRLTSLDAMQMATALIIARKLPSSNQLQFVSSDKKLLTAVGAEGLDTWDPAGP